MAVPCKCPSTKHCCIVLVLGLLACVFERFANLSSHRTLDPRTATLDSRRSPQTSEATGYSAEPQGETLDGKNVPSGDASGPQTYASAFEDNSHENAHASASNEYIQPVRPDEPIEPPEPPVSTNCIDVTDWADSEGEGCSSYSNKRYCRADGGFGTGWKEYWGGFSDYGRKGHTADSACCACGRSGSMINFHPQKVYTLERVADVGKFLMLIHTENVTASRVWEDPLEGGERSCQWRIQATAVRNEFTLENVKWAGMYLSLNSRGTDVEVTSNPQAAAKWHFERASSPNTFRVISKRFEKGLMGSTKSVRLTQKNQFNQRAALWRVRDRPPVPRSAQWWERKSAFGSASNLSAFAVLCCNWNTAHKRAGFWSTVEGGDMGPVGALLQQLRRLEKCSWFRDDASLRILVFYERPPPKTRGIRKQDYWSLPGLRDRLQVVNVEDAFQPPKKSYRFHDGLLRYGWGYRIANHFWSQRVFWMPEVRSLEYLLRLDEDSVLRCEGRSSAFDAMRKGGHVYGYYDLITDAATVSINFGQTVLTYLNITKHKPAWNLDHNVSNWRYSPTYYNDFEIMYIPHFRSRAVQNFTAHMVKSKGIYEWRWADGSVRFAQVALTAPPQKVKCFLRDELDYLHQGTVPDRKLCSICLGRYVISGHFSGRRPQQWCRDCVGHGLSRMESLGFIEEPQEIWRSRRVHHPTHDKKEVPWLESYVKTSFNCPAGKRIGSGDGGGGWVCNPHKIADEVASGKGCLVYSIRSGGDRSFEDGVVEQISKACDIHVFSIVTSSIPGNGYQTWRFDYSSGARSSSHGGLTQHLPSILSQLNHAGKQLQVDILNVDCKECGVLIIDACRSILNAGLEVRQILLTFRLDQASLGQKEQTMIKSFFQFLTSKGYETFHQPSPAPNHVAVSLLKLRKSAEPWCGHGKSCNDAIFRCPL